MISTILTVLCLIKIETLLALQHSMSVQTQADQKRGNSNIFRNIENIWEGEMCFG